MTECFTEWHHYVLKDPYGSYSTNWLTPQTVRRACRKVGRNEPCPCGSGRKFKNCCMENEKEKEND